jgi:hypothetical protein
LYKEYHDQEWGIQFMTMLHYLNFTTWNLSSRIELDYHSQ